MKIIDLDEEQVEDIEARLSAFDENFITYKMDGCIRIGVEDDGRLIAGLDACITAFRIFMCPWCLLMKHTEEKASAPA